jgi:hypothetical protein
MGVPPIGGENRTGMGNRGSPLRAIRVILGLSNPGHDAIGVAAQAMEGTDL